MCRRSRLQLEKIFCDPAKFYVPEFLTAAIQSCANMYRSTIWGYYINFHKKGLKKQEAKPEVIQLPQVNCFSALVMKKLILTQ
jgi:hypothetical protein